MGGNIFSLLETLPKDLIGAIKNTVPRPTMQYGTNIFRPLVFSKKSVHINRSILLQEPTVHGFRFKHSIEAGSYSGEIL